MSFFIIDLEIPYATASALAVVFMIFSTLFLFRLLDDAGSYYVDRADLTRKYLEKKRFKYFLLINGITAIAYFSFLAFLKYSYTLHIFALYLFSALAYVFFSKQKRVVQTIPFLKYPLIFWALSTGDLLLGIGVMFIFVLFDLLESDRDIWLSSFLTLITGILIFNTSLADWRVLSAILGGVLFTYFMKNKYFLLVYFPTLYLLYTSLR